MVRSVLQGKPVIQIFLVNLHNYIKIRLSFAITCIEENIEEVRIS